MLNHANPSLFIFLGFPSFHLTIDLVNNLFFKFAFYKTGTAKGPKKTGGR